MMDKLCRFVQFSVILTPFAIAVAEISLDYYFGNSLRSDLELDCGREVMKNTCQLKCGPEHACLLGKCFCLQKEEEPLSEDSEEIEKSTEEENTIIDFQDYTEMTPLLRPQLPIAVFEPKLALRHHIAHFCPNLGLARECVGRCSKLGKPAFCGKDHVCYCGHIYDYPVDNGNNVDPADAYIEFKDMYEKYFGPRGGSSSTTKITPVEGSDVNSGDESDSSSADGSDSSSADGSSSSQAEESGSNQSEGSASVENKSSASASAESSEDTTTTPTTAEATTTTTTNEDPTSNK